MVVAGNHRKRRRVNESRGGILQKTQLDGEPKENRERNSTVLSLTALLLYSTQQLVSIVLCLVGFVSSVLLPHTKTTTELARVVFLALSSPL